ncbi:unnamed protein product [Amoebophrya sp. A120]|nr:unnamed protein product [Amoebophrya sp. A120]|eukprot:GSA120T00021720001.1
MASSDSDDWPGVRETRVLRSKPARSIHPTAGPARPPAPWTICCKLLFPWCYRRNQDLDASSSSDDEDLNTFGDGPHDPTRSSLLYQSSEEDEAEQSLRRAQDNRKNAKTHGGGAGTGAAAAGSSSILGPRAPGDRDRGRGGTQAAKSVRSTTALGAAPRGTATASQARTARSVASWRRSGASGQYVDASRMYSKLSRTSLDDLFLSSDEDDEEGNFRRSLSFGPGSSGRKTGTKPRRFNRFCQLLTATCVALWLGVILFFVIAANNRRRPEPPLERKAKVRYHYLPTATSEDHITYTNPVSVAETNWIWSILKHDHFPVPRTPEQVVVFLEIGPEETQVPEVVERHAPGAEPAAPAAGGLFAQLFGGGKNTAPKAPARRRPFRSLLGPLDKHDPLDMQMRDMITQGLVDEKGAADLQFLLSSEELRLSVWDTNILEKLSNEYTTAAKSTEDLTPLEQSLYRRQQALVATDLYFRSGRNLLVAEGAVLDVSPETFTKIVTEGPVVALKSLLHTLQHLRDKKFGQNGVGAQVPLGNRFRQLAGLLQPQREREAGKPQQLRVIGAAARHMADELRTKLDALLGSGKIKVLVEQALEVQESLGVPESVVQAVRQELAGYLAPIADELARQLAAARPP